MKRRIFFTTAFTFLILCFGILFSSNRAYAADYSSILNKWLYTQYYQCFKDYAAGKITGIEKSSSNVLNDVFAAIGTYNLPSYNLAGSNTTLTCREIVKGKDGLSAPFTNGVLGSYKNTTWKDKSSAETLMIDKLKYSKISSSTGGSFVIDYYMNNSTAPLSSGTITATPDSNGNLQYSLKWGGNVTSFVQIHIDNKAGTIKISVPSGGDAAGYTIVRSSLPVEAQLSTTSIEDTYADIERKLSNASVTVRMPVGCSPIGGWGQIPCTDTVYTFGADGKSIVDSSNATGYEKQTNSAVTSMEALSPYGSAIFSYTDYYNLYTYYLKNAAGGLNALTCDPGANTNNLAPVKLINDSGEVTQCYANLMGVNTSVQVYTQVEGPAIGTISLQSAIDWLNNSRHLSGVNPNEVPGLSDLAPPATVDPSASGSNNSGSSDTGVPACTGAAQGLSWIVCPVLKFAGETVGSVYDWIATSFLTVPSGFLTQGDNNGTYGGWSAFRNFANIIFAILFVIVIFSQVTGIGLSNYNIKTMLPRLVVVVILVNISFILCQLAVDLSNIVGYQINKLFEGLANGNGLKMSAMAELVQVAVSGSSGTGEVLVGAGISIGVALLTWKIWLLPLMLSLFGVLIGVIFFFIILGVRQAGVIVMVAIAPLAIVCYALPNTKPLFDRWWKLFSALLLVYPICGALMGGGVFASAMMMGNLNNGTVDHNFLYVVVSMLLCVVPFFFVPAILKNSMQGLGQLGARISNFGSGISKSGTKAIRQSETYQDARSALQASRAGDTLRRSKIGNAIGSALGSTKVGKYLASHGPTGAFVRNRNARLARAQRIESGYYRGQISDKTELAAGRFRPGSERYEGFAASAESQLEDAEVANRVAAYEAGRVGDVRPEDMSSIKRALDAQFTRLRENPEDKNALTDAKALSEMLLSRGGPGMSEFEQSYLNAIHDDTSGASDAAIRKITNNATKKFGSNISQKHNVLAETMKKASEANGLNTIRGGGWGRTSDNKLLSAFGIKKGIGSLKAGSLASASSAMRRQLIDSVDAGLIKGEALQNLMSMASEVMTQPNYDPESEAGSDIRNLLALGYAKRGENNGVVTDQNTGQRSISTATTDGSQALYGANTDTLDAMINQIETTNENGGYVLGDDTVRGMAENVRNLLNDDRRIFDEGQVDRLQQVLAAADRRGVQDSLGGNFDSRITPARVQIRGAQTSTPQTAQARPQKVESPYIRDFRDSSKWINRRTGKRITDPATIAKAEQAEKYNNEIDFREGKWSS